MPYTRLLVHAVWATKNRHPIMTISKKNNICTHIREYTKSKNIHLININGWNDHLHALLSLTPEQNISTIINLIKGESSFWANKNLKWTEKFGWQNDYFAVSISQSHFERVNGYISNQELHHQKKTFEKEYREFIQNYQFEKEIKG
jgi:REP element-mobilizing transposase RayT